MPVRFRTQLSKTVASALVATTAASGIITSVSSRQNLSNFESVRSEFGNQSESSCITLVQSRFESALG